MIAAVTTPFGDNDIITLLSRFAAPVPVRFRAATHLPAEQRGETFRAPLLCGGRLGLRLEHGARQCPVPTRPDQIAEWGRFTAPV